MSVGSEAQYIQGESPLEQKSMETMSSQERWVSSTAFILRLHCVSIMHLHSPLAFCVSSTVFAHKRECITNANANTLMDTLYYNSTELIQNTNANMNAVEDTYLKDCIFYIDNVIYILGQVHVWLSVCDLEITHRFNCVVY